MLSVEREAWGRERTRLEKGLRLAEAELTRLRGEMRNDTLRDMSGPDADNAALKVQTHTHTHTHALSLSHTHTHSTMTLVWGHSFSMRRLL